MAQDGKLIIAESFDGNGSSLGMLGASPLGVGSPSAAQGFILGTNDSGMAPYFNNWPYADIVKTSFGWVPSSGSGNVSIDNQDRVQSIDSGYVLGRQVIDPGKPDGTVPPGGSYRVRWTGTGEVSAGFPGNQNGYTSWQTGGEFTFTLPADSSLDFYIRNGSILSLECVHPVDQVAYDGGQAWRQSWLTTILSFGNKIIRPLTNQDHTVDFTDRTLPVCLSYHSPQDRGTGFYHEQGANYRNMPYELMCDLANRLDAHLAFNLSPYATTSCVQSIGEIIENSLNIDLLNISELANETWNYGGAFFQNQQWIGMRNVPKTLLSLTPGSNTAAATSHGFAEGELFRVISSSGSDRVPEFGTNLFTHAQTLRAINVTANTFDIVLDSDSSQIIPLTGETEIYAWRQSDYPGNTAASIEDIDFNTGAQSVEFWNAFKAGMSTQGSARVREIIGTQQGDVERTDRRVGANGSNGRYDFISVGAYFGLETAVQAWAPGDSLTKMYADGLADLNDAMAGLDFLINGGYPADQIFIYEGGQHYLDFLVTNGTPAQAHAAFLIFVASQEMADLYQVLHEALAQRGVWGGCTSCASINQWSTFGYWYGLEREGDSGVNEHPRVTLLKSYNGLVPYPVS